MLISLLLACVQAEGNFSGKAVYRDGTPVAREAPEESQPVMIDVEFGGTGTFGDLDGLCLPTDGSFTGSTSSEGSIDGDGNVVAQVDATASGTLLESTLGCVTEALDIQSVTTITLKATIEADTENCDRYCTSEASAACEAEAGGEGGSAECEAEVAASCTEECTTERHSLVAETTLDGGAELQSLNDGLEGNVFGAFSAELAFTEME